MFTIATIVGFSGFGTGSGGKDAPATCYISSSRRHPGPCFIRLEALEAIFKDPGEDEFQVLVTSSGFSQRRALLRQSHLSLSGRWFSLSGGACCCRTSSTRAALLRVRCREMPPNRIRRNRNGNYEKTETGNR